MGELMKPVRDICTNHSARNKRDARICPSKLSKRELEDLYYNLHQNNINLKRANNVQQQNFKILSTKLQRLTAGQKTIGRETSDCCSGANSLIKEQRESIAELKRLNASLTEKNRLLNMKMCSAKQFMKQSPPRNRCSNTNLLYMRNSSMSLLSTKRSDNNLQTVQPVPQNIEKSLMSERAEANDEKIDTPEQDNNMQVVPKKLCDENKCKTLMEELKNKIVDLEKELTTVQGDCSLSVSRLKLEVKELQEVNINIAGEKAVEDINLQGLRDEVEGLKSRLREADAKNGDLTMQLSIERSKVAELETRLKSVVLSNSLGDFIEEHLCKIKDTRADTSNESYNLDNIEWKESSPGSRVPLVAKRSIASETLDSSGITKSDDSGYTEPNKSTLHEDKASTKLNMELLHRIADLQAQVDILKVEAAANSPKPVVVEDKPINISDNEYQALLPENDAEVDSHSTSGRSVSPVKDRDTKTIIGDKVSIRTDVSNIEIVEKHLNKNITSNDPNPKVTKSTKSHEPISYINYISKRVGNYQKRKKSKKKCDPEYLKTIKSVNDELETKQSKSHQVETYRKTIHEEVKGTEISEKACEKCKKKQQNDECACPPADDNKHFPSPSNSYTEFCSRKKISEVETVTKLTAVRGSEKHMERVGLSSLDNSGTYTVDGGRESPQCTDYEISTMSDLPSEKETSRHFSPGEDRGDVFSESYTMTTEYGSLSIGEVPGRRGKKLSVGEKIEKSGTNTQKPQLPERLDDALKSITEELNRCRRMLLARPATEVT